jgi:hypothetical protein
MFLKFQKVLAYLSLDQIYDNLTNFLCENVPLKALWMMGGGGDPTSQPSDTQKCWVQADVPIATLQTNIAENTPKMPFFHYWQKEQFRCRPWDSRTQILSTGHCAGRRQSGRHIRLNWSRLKSLLGAVCRRMPRECRTPVTLSACVTKKWGPLMEEIYRSN